MMNKRIVVTGIGAISSIGIGKNAFWEALIQGKSGISPITTFDTSEYPTHLGGEVKNFRAQDFMSRRKAQQIGRASAFALAAAKLAIDDSRLDIAQCNRERIGVALGTTMAETQIFEELNTAWVQRGAEAINPRFIPRLLANVLAANIAIAFKLKGPNYVIPTACAAGNYAIGYACDMIEQGIVDSMLAGGSDAFSRIAFTGFNRLLAVASQKCQPFDKHRKGMMVGEGAGVILLEPLESALKRGAGIYAEVLGYGLSCDAHHMTAPYGPGIARAFEKALLASGITYEEVDYINAHGTGTPANDREECLAMRVVFKGHYKKLLVSSIKSMLGHTMGAASALESIACCLTVKHDIVPPTINFETYDPDCDIDCVPNICRHQKVTIALNSASAFGGNNACVVFKKFLP